jgi:hypothetical protein
LNKAEKANMTKTETNKTPVCNDTEDSYLRKQAWDYFSVHAAQRLTIFNFYIGLSSATATGYFASLKSDSNLGPMRTLLALLLCFFAFVFWKLDERTKALIGIAEDSLKYFERSQAHHIHAKVFTHEETTAAAQRRSLKGWRATMFWRWPLSYTKCFHLVYLSFFLMGVAALMLNHPRAVEWCWDAIRRLV